MGQSESPAQLVVSVLLTTKSCLIVVPGLYWRIWSTSLMRIG